MAIMAKKPEGGDFVRVLAPSGLHPVVCCDVVDRGLVESEYQGLKRVQPKISIHFLMADLIPETWTHPHTHEVVDVPPTLAGRPYGVGKWFTNTLHEKSNLRRFLETWRGRGLTQAELEGFDVERVIGVGGAVSIVHRLSEKTGNWYANIDGISAIPDGWETPSIPPDYVRLAEREDSPDQPQPTQEPQAMTGPPPLYEGGPQEPEYDDDLPF